jgi:uncharacterized protein with gpF-like domain
MSGFIPKTALDYIKSKSPKPGFSYKDVWHEERATGFAAAKAMRLDALSGPHNAAIAAVENGQSFDTFKKNIAPALRQKGWRGKKNMPDPLTGKTASAQPGSGRRLKTVYRVNTRSACQKGPYGRTMQSEPRPCLTRRKPAKPRGIPGTVFTGSRPCMRPAGKRPSGRKPACGP